MGLEPSWCLLFYLAVSGAAGTGECGDLAGAWGMGRRKLRAKGAPGNHLLRTAPACLLSPANECGTHNMRNQFGGRELTEKRGFLGGRAGSYHSVGQLTALS